MIGKKLINIITWEIKFLSHLNLEDITNADYTHKKRIHEDFEMNLDEYQNFMLKFIPCC